MTWDEYKDKVKVKTSDPVAKQDIEEAEAGAQQDKHDLDRFDAIMAESQNYATEVGMTDDDIDDAIRTVRQRKRGSQHELAAEKAMKSFQQQMAGEAEKAGIKTEDDVAAWITESRRKDTYE